MENQIKPIEVPSPEQIAIEFTPVVNTLNGEVITSAWEFVKMAFTHDKPYLGMDVRTRQPNGCEYQRFQVFTRNDIYVTEIIAESLNSYEDAIKLAVQKAWELVSEDFSCRYGIWEDEKQLRELIEDALCPEDASHWVEMLGRLEANVGGAK